MGKINLLTSEVYNKISAGEVVERPASIVKELVENAVDAGASTVKITIKESGTDYINVTDNGCGISMEELPLAFMPHATSKIQTEDDLNAIKTLGFRGEALASIAAVSKLTAISKTQDATTGYVFTVEGGRYGDIHEAGANTGTSITVTDLFFNTPARLKFLKKPKGELSEITNTVARLILANPEISIKYTINNDVIFNSQGNGMENAFYCIYGAEALANCIPIEVKYKNYTICGFISSINYTKSNSTYQTLVINGRYVVNNTVTTAVKVAYKSYLMTRQYPMYLLYLTIPYDEIDVNVHPNKLDVRFIDSKAIFSAFYSAVNRMLQQEEKRIISDIRRQDLNISDYTDSSTNNVSDGNSNESTFTEELNSQNPINQTVSFAFDSIPSLPDEVASLFDTSKASDKTPSPEAIFEKLTKQKDNTESFLQAELIKKCSVFDTYLLLEDDVGKCVYLIDQHAAHERLIFDRLQKEYEENKLAVQPLLLPYIFEVNSVEDEFINTNLSLFRECGFEVSPYGKRSYRIDTVPLILSNISLESFIKQTLSDLELGDINSFTHDFLAKTACHNAVKAGETLSDTQIDTLLSLLRNNTALKCPHGRPVVVKLDKYEIEKWFKRIV